MADSTTKRVTGRYHPYENTTSDIAQRTSNTSTNDTSMVDATNDNVDMMDVEGLFLSLSIFSYVY